LRLAVSEHPPPDLAGQDAADLRSTTLAGKRSRRAVSRANDPGALLADAMPSQLVTRLRVRIRGVGGKMAALETSGWSVRGLTVVGTAQGRGGNSRGPSGGGVIHAGVSSFRSWRILAGKFLALG